MKFKKRNRALSTAMVFLIILAALSGCTLKGEEHSDDSIIIGVFEPMSGDLEKKAAEEIKGIELAHEMHPEVLGKKIELDYQDNKSTIAGAEAAAVNIVKAKCAAVIGSYGSTLSIAGGSVFKEAKLPAISATATNPLVTSGNDYYFRACYIDTYQGITMAKYAFENLGARKAFVIYNQDDDFGATVGDIFASKLKDLINNEKKALASALTESSITSGQAVVNTSVSSASDSEDEPKTSTQPQSGVAETDLSSVVTARYTTDQSDFTNMLSNIKAKDPDVIFIPSSVTESDVIIRQIRNMGYDGLFLGTNTWMDPSLVHTMGTYAEGIVFPVIYDQTTKENDEASLFINAYREKYGYTEEIPEAAALGYDAYMLAVSAISNAGTSEDGTLIRQKLYETQEYSGLTGSITFMWSNDPVKSVVLRTVKDGEMTYCDTMTPTFTNIE